MKSEVFHFRFFQKKSSEKEEGTLSRPSLFDSLCSSSQREREREIARTLSQGHARAPLLERHRGRRRRSGGGARLSLFFFFIDVDIIGVCFFLPVSLRVGGSPSFGQAPRRGGVRTEPRMRRRCRGSTFSSAREVEKGTRRKGRIRSTSSSSLFSRSRLSPHLLPPVEFASRARCLCILVPCRAIKWLKTQREPRSAPLIVLT